jgi:hypothetical protein
MRVKKGQLRRWKSDDIWDGKVFMTLSSRVVLGRDRRHEIGHGNPRRGEIMWTILQEENRIEDIPQMEIHSDSEVIDETR